MSTKVRSDDFVVCTAVFVLTGLDPVICDGFKLFTQSPSSAHMAGTKFDQLLGEGLRT